MQKFISALLLLSTLAVPVLSQNRSRAGVPKQIYPGNGASAEKEQVSRRGSLDAKLVRTPRSGLTIERYSSSYDIRPDGTAIQVFEVQQKCQLASCLGRVGTVRQEFNGNTHDIKLLAASVTRANGKKIDLPTASGKVMPTPQAEAAPGFSSMKQFELEFPAVAVGDSVRYKIQMDTLKPIFATDFDSIERFPLMYDWNSIEITVSAPEELKLQFDAPGLQGGQVAAEAGRAHWRWQAAGLKAFEPESVMLDPISPSPRFVVTTAGSFEELGQHFGAGVREKAVITPAVQKLADEITTGLKTPEEQAAAIYQWVNKNIRYLLVVLDRGGWVPHSTTEILKNGYGDCKDYTTLIHALLKAKGIESTPVLINADFGSWFPKVPASSYFNHAILYVPGLKLFADATAPNTRLGIVPQQLTGKTALLSSDKSGLIEVPKNDPDANRVFSDVKIEVADNGDLKAVSKNVVSGRTEMLVRQMFGEGARSLPPDTLVKVMLAVYGISGTGRVLSISDPHRVAEPFALDMEISIPDYTTIVPKGLVALPVGLNMNSLSLYEMFTTEEKRSTDLLVGATRIRERYVLKLPAGAVFGELPPPVNFSNAAGQLTSTYVHSEEGVEIVRELIIAKDAYTPAEYPLFKELVRNMVASLNPAIAYTADPRLLKAKTSARPRSGAKPAKSGMEAVLSSLMSGIDDPKLPPARVRRLEANVTAQPDDTDSRVQLLRHYMSYDVRETPALIKARIAHRLWFVQNRPEISTDLIYGIFARSDRKDTPEYALLRDEWLKQIETHKNKKAVRLNAVGFIQPLEPELAKRILREGIAADPDVYEFPFQLAGLIRVELDDVNTKLSPEDRSIKNREVLDLGKIALVLIRKERSEERDEDRGQLSLNLCRAALEVGDMDLAASLGRDLAVEFGSDINSPAYSQAAHIGNVALGMAELSHGNIAQAAEHLLISIRAPRRKPGGYFTGVDFTLAKALFRKGEKKAVVDFLKQTLELDSFKEEPEAYKVRIAAIREWLTLAEQGIEPSFDFEKSAPKK